mgnify:CR=1 FL=1
MAEDEDKTKTLSGMDAYDYLLTFFENLDHFDPNIPTITNFDLEYAPLSIVGMGAENGLRPNTMAADAKTEYDNARVLMPWKVKSPMNSTHGGGQGLWACKAYVPELHGITDDPVGQEDPVIKAAMINTLPTFVAREPLNAPISIHSIVKVKFDNPHDMPFGNGVLLEVMDPQPDWLPQWAENIPSLKSLYEDASKWVPGAVSFISHRTAGMDFGGPAAEIPLADFKAAANTTPCRAKLTAAGGPCAYDPAAGELTFSDAGNDAPILPVTGKITSVAGQHRTPADADPYTHRGTDISNQPVGTPVQSMLDGHIVDINPEAGGYGGWVSIEYKYRSGESYTVDHAHLSTVPEQAAIGDPVKKGQTIGLSGGAKSAPGAGFSYGPHLHVEYYSGTGANKTLMHKDEIEKTFGWDLSVGIMIVGGSDCEAAAAC